MTILKRETWAKKRVYVVRSDRGAIKTWIPAKGINPEQARTRYKTKGTFSGRYEYKEHEFSTGIRESSRLYPVKKDVPARPIRRKGFISAQYVIGSYDIGTKQGIWGRSDKIKGNSKSAMITAQEQAAKRFYSLLDRHFTGRYDEDEGMELAVANNIKVSHGFVWYSRYSKRKVARS